MHTALLVIDVQQSFLHRPYWTDADLPAFLERMQALIGAPIDMVSTGPDREHTILLKHPYRG